MTNTSVGTVVDTDVFSLLYVFSRDSDPRIPSWHQTLKERRVIVSFQTRAEILAGGRRANWGQARMDRVAEILDQTPTIRADDEVIKAYADLSAACQAAGHPLQAAGHPLQDKPHTGDRWIAACAIAKQFALLSGDAIFVNAPNLSLVL